MANLAVFASLIGTTVEWYDFFIYGTVTGLVFGKLFFPTGNPLVSLLLAYTTYAVGFATVRWAASCSAISATGSAASRCWCSLSRSWGRHLPDRRAAELSSDRHRRTDHPAAAAAVAGHRAWRRMGRRRADGVRIRPARTSGGIYACVPQVGLAMAFPWPRGWWRCFRTCSRLPRSRPGAGAWPSC